MKITILNTHSILNSGDAGIVLAQIQLLRKIFPSSDIALTSRTPDLDRKFFAPLGITVHGPLIPAPSIFRGWFRKVWGSLCNLFSISRKYRLIKRIKASDLILASGGGYLFCNRKHFPGPMYFQNLLHLLLACRWNKPLVFLPQSFGPFFNKWSQRMARSLLDRSNVLRIFVRENHSGEMLLSWLKKNSPRVEYCPDLFFNLKTGQETMDPVFPITLPGPVLALTLRDWRFPECGTGEYEEKRNAYLHSFVEVCRYVHQTLKGSVVVFAQVRGPGPEEDDRIISGQFYKRLGPLIPETHRQMLDIPECVSPASIPEIFTHIDVLLGTRFHSVVSALIASTPAIAVSYQPKSRGIMKAMGIQEYCLDIGELTSQALIQRLDAVLQNYPSLVAKIKSEVSVARKQIEAAFSKIPLLVPPHDQNENTAGK